MNKREGGGEKLKRSEAGRLSGEINELRHSVDGLDARLQGAAEAMGGFAAALRRLDNHQRETSVQLDEIGELLRGDSSEADALIGALIDIAGHIENFYLFASEDVASPLFAQAEMMWGAARKSLKEAGLTVINGEGAPLDFRLHAPVRTGSDESLPDGYVLKALESGYIYGDKIIRRASVIVNKKDRREGVMT